MAPIVEDTRPGQRVGCAALQLCDNGADAPATVRSVERARKRLWEYRRQMNALKDSIKSGRTVVGTTATPNVDVAILADAGYDFVLLDTQHSAWVSAALRKCATEAAG
jgi:hypothetical protein